MKRHFISICPRWLKWIIPCLFLTACFEPELEELPFFSVKTLPVIEDASGIIGQVSIKGEIQGLGDATLEDYGFLFSDDITFVEDESNIAQSNHRFGELTNNTPSFPFETSVQVEEGSNYFVRAYAKMGERIILGNIQFYSVNIDLDIEMLEHQNDKLSFRARISGLTDNIDVEDFGVLMANKLDNLNFSSALKKSYGQQMGDFIQTDTFHNLNFNTTYYLKAYAIGFDTTYSEVRSYHIQDGWRQLAPVPISSFGIANAVAISDNENAYLAGGCFVINSDTCGMTTLNNALYKFTSSDDKGNGTWESIDENVDVSVAVSQAIGVYHNNQILVGFGRINGDTELYINRLINVLNDSSPLNGCPSYGDINSTDAVAFSTNDAIYIGTGETVNGNTNAFWKMTLVDDCMEVEAMPPLPIRRNGMDDINNAGREGAVALQIGNRFFVGFGRNITLPLNDLYEFHYSTGSDPYWSFVNSSYAPPHREEAMSFSIGERAFVGFGENDFTDESLNDLWEFYPDNAPNDVWKKREPLPGVGRKSGFSFALNGFGYIGSGEYQLYPANSGKRLLKDTWVYIPSID